MSDKVKLKKIPKDLNESTKEVVREFTSTENKFRKSAGKGDYSETKKISTQIGMGFSAYKIADLLGITFKSKGSFRPNPGPIEIAIENLGIESSGIRVNTRDTYKNGGHGRSIVTEHAQYEIKSIKEIKKEIENESKLVKKDVFSYKGENFRVLD